MSASKFGALIALAAGLAGLAHNPVPAASVSIDDSGSNGTVTVSACDFENGAFVNGSLLGLCGSGYGGSVTLAKSAPGPVTFRGGWVDQGQAGKGSRTVYLVKADTPTQIDTMLTYSWVSSGPGSVNLLVEYLPATGGDPEFLASGVDAGDVFVKNGQPVTFDLAALKGRLLSAGAVPEPDGPVSVGPGPGGIAFSRRKN